MPAPFRTFAFNRQEEADLKEALGIAIELFEESLKDDDDPSDQQQTLTDLERYKSLFHTFRWLPN